MRPDERDRHLGSFPILRPSMSVQDMIGADVESGGLFDPLGENVCLRIMGHQRIRDVQLATRV